MTLSERVKELERRVTELERRFYPSYPPRYYPHYPGPGPEPIWLGLRIQSELSEKKDNH